MGCAHSQEAGTAETRTEDQNAPARPGVVAEDCLVLPNSDQNPADGIDHSKKRIKGNQVAPEPRQQREPLSVRVPSVRTVSSPIQTKWGSGSNWDQREISPRAWPTFIQELQQWAHLARSDRDQVLGPDKASRLQGLTRQAAAWLDAAAAMMTTGPPATPQRNGGAASGPPTILYEEAAAMIEACALSASHLADCALRPIVSHAERVLTNGVASTSGRASHGSSQWDTIQVEDLVQILQSSSMSELGVELDTATQTAKSAAELLLLLQEHSPNSRLRAHAFNCIVSGALYKSP